MKHAREPAVQVPIKESTRLHGVQSLDRAIAILHLLAIHQTCGLALSSIVAKTGLDRTTVIESRRRSWNPASRHAIRKRNIVSVSKRWCSAWRQCIGRRLSSTTPRP
ncbi:helix-turn-helix domain-containing protein [Paraburkholderia sp. LEh10]|uniref:helix-turn-helix domain-containing protein n=1 Tax=Paraburkholderia sp. LEh10 TaxID=2821353 RepID=UPI001AE7EFF9|nr:helix-turn-helix domain-containing protein [Paraburkholderia sp. LEh10]MBP0594293.1 helix-turn-helix domain-containing protein [Paraburkholderia sp. LEh10]